ncbi:MAG: nickel pincer cofactor biosynthesis protein LarC [Oscillospiraceae bacterium]
MKTLYLECNMGAAGDMLAAALLELVPDADTTLARLNALGLPGVTFALERKELSGIVGSHLRVSVKGGEEHSHDIPHGHDHAEHHHDDGHHHDHDHDHSDGHHHAHHHVEGHSHMGMGEIAHTIGHLAASQWVKDNALAVYRLIAEAESAAHGRPVEQVHFHEVGALDAVADVTAVCLLMEELAPGAVLASPVHVGNGQVRCAHGILPVPAPATAWLLQGIPSYGGEIAGELCTPTGAALLRHFVRSFGPRPVMRTDKIGYGMGTKEFPVLNAVRAYLGETAAQTSDGAVELRCNIDDMTGEDLAVVQSLLMEAGALDAWLAPILMKKGRPGQLLSCLCREEDAERLTGLILRHTTTWGVRRQMVERTTLERRVERIETSLGLIDMKIGSGDGFIKRKPEHDQLAALAREAGISVAEARERILGGGK